MKLRQALFCSSIGTTHLDMREGVKQYRLRIEERQEEYTPAFYWPPATGTGPFFRPVYLLSVSFLKNDVIAEPHHAESFYDIDSCEELLNTWRIDVDQGWIPEEEEE